MSPVVIVDVGAVVNARAESVDGISDEVVNEPSDFGPDSVCRWPHAVARGNWRHAADRCSRQAAALPMRTDRSPAHGDAEEESQAGQRDVGLIL
jgi:hypothetical protein